jgi:hypothetical protein
VRDATTDIVLSDETIGDICSYLPEHEKMLDLIREARPELQRATSLFSKRQSQFMDNVLTVSHPTPIRNLRQILSEIERATQALRETYSKNKLDRIKIQMRLRDAEKTDDSLKRSLYLAKAEQIQNRLDGSQSYISGAIRRVANHVEQYQSILREMGVEHFSEIDFEAEEERYHIMTSFSQALTAARSRPNLMIDEGNLGYLFQLGINPGVAQKEVARFLQDEIAMLKANLEGDGPEPSHEMILAFLDDMAEKFKGCSSRYATHRGMTGVPSEVASLVEGDTRLLR